MKTQRAEWHIGPGQQTPASKKVEIEPVFFVSFTEGGGVLLNDDITVLTPGRFAATVAAVRAVGRETLPGSGVYAMNMSQLRQVQRHVRTDALYRHTHATRERHAANAAWWRQQQEQQTSITGNDCLTCPFIEDCTCASVECNFYDGPPEQMTAQSLEQAGTYSPREEF
jgi:hypothetical protein